METLETVDIDPSVGHHVEYLRDEHEEQQHCHHPLASLARALETLEHSNDNPVDEDVERHKDHEKAACGERPFAARDENAPPDAQQPNHRRESARAKQPL